MNQDPLGRQPLPSSSTRAPLTAQPEVEEPLFAAINSDDMFKNADERKRYVSNALSRLKEMGYKQQGDERVFKAFIKAIDKRFLGTAKLFLIGRHIKSENVYLTFFAALDRAESDPDNLKVAQLIADDKGKFIDVNIKFPDTGNTILHRYVLSQNKEACRFLWNLPAIDKNAVDSNSKTALALAVEKGYVDIVEIFNPEKAKKMRARSATMLAGASPAANPQVSPTGSPATSTTASTVESSPALASTRKGSGSSASIATSETATVSAPNPLMEAITSSPPNATAVARYLQYRGSLKNHPYFAKMSEEAFAKEIILAFDKALELGLVGIAAHFVDFRNNVEINATARGDKSTFLHRYAEKGNLPAVQFIYRHEKFEKHYETNANGENALHIAAAKGNVEIVNFLLSESIKKSTLDRITSILSTESSEVNPLLVKQDLLGKYPLQLALLANKPEVFKKLLPLMPDDIVKQLAPEMLASAKSTGAAGILVCLLADVRVDISPKKNGDDSLLNGLITDLFNKLHENTQGKFALWKALVDSIAGRNSNKYNFSILNNQGKTPLHTAIELICTTDVFSESQISIYAQFIDPLIAAAGKYINSKDNSGRSPLQFAVQMRVDSRPGSMASKISLRIIEKLLDNPNCDAKEINVFNVAIERKDDELFNLLNKQQTSVVGTATTGVSSSPKLGSPAAQDGEGKNALHLLVARGEVDKIKTLLGRPDIGSALNAADNQGNTPLTLAMEILSKHPKIAPPPAPVAEVVPSSHATSGVSGKGQQKSGATAQTPTRIVSRPGTVAGKKSSAAVSKFKFMSGGKTAVKAAASSNNDAEVFAGSTQPLTSAAAQPLLASAAPLPAASPSSAPALVLDEETLRKNAVHDTQLQIIELFLSHPELDPNFQPRRDDRFERAVLFDTALHVAVNLRNVDLAGKILSLKGKYPTDPNITNNNNYRPLDIAVMNGDAVMVALLLNHKKSERPDDKTIATDPNRFNFYGRPLKSSTGISPLHYALQQLSHQLAKEREYNEIVKSLLGHPAIDVNEKNLDAGGETPLHVAIRLERVDIVRLLLANGKISPNVANNLGETPLMLAVRNFLPAKEATKEIVKLLLEHSAVKPDYDPKEDNPGQSDITRRTPFNLAISRRYPDLLKLFLEAHQKAAREGKREKLIDLDRRNGNGQTPLILAMHQMVSNSVSGQQEAEGSGAAVVIRAQNLASPEIIANSLLEYGANPNITGADEDHSAMPSHYSYTPAEFAVVNGESHRKLLLKLIKSGAKIDANKNYRDAKHPLEKVMTADPRRSQRAAFPDDLANNPGLILFYDLSENFRGVEDGDLSKEAIKTRIGALKQHIQFYKDMKTILFAQERNLNFNLAQDVLKETDSLISKMEDRIKTTEQELKGNDPGVKHPVSNNDLLLMLAVNKATYLTYSLIKDPHIDKHRQEYSNIRDYLSDSRFGRKLAGAMALVLSAVCLAALGVLFFCTFPYALPLVPMMYGAGGGAGFTFLTGSTCLFFSNSRRSVLNAMDTLKEETSKLPTAVPVR